MSEPATETSLSRPSYGWALVAVLFVCAFVIQGTALGGLTMFDAQVLKALDVGRGALKFRDSIYIVSTALCCFAMAWMVERVGVRAVMIAGLVLLSLIYLGYSTIHSIYVVYLLHALLGFSFASAHVVLMMIVIARWFGTGDAKRGIALGIAASGASCGAFVLTRVIPFGLGMFEWRQLMVVLALVPLLLVPVVWFVVRSPEPKSDDPWRLKLRGPGMGFSFKAIASWSAVGLLLAILPIFYVSASVASHAFLLLSDQHLPKEIAAGGVGSFFLCGLFGKFLSGFFLVRLRLPLVWAFFVSMMLVGSFLLFAYTGTAYTPALWLIGLGWGGCLPLAQLCIADLYPGPGMARVLGLFVVCESLGAASGSWLTGVAYDNTGSYRVALIFNISILVVALATYATLMARRRQPVPMPA